MKKFKNAKIIKKKKKEKHYFMALYALFEFNVLRLSCVIKCVNAALLSFRSGNFNLMY